MSEILIEPFDATPTARQSTECVERKGLGHPDTICDAVMESVSVALCREYLARAGRVLHHNVDKGLLVAGQTSPALGGGRVTAPMRLVLGDRATGEFEGRRIDVGEIAVATARDWFDRNLRFVDPKKHVVFQNEIQPGAAELVGVFGRAHPVANDTSAGVGYAPLTETERLVLAAERTLNAAEFKARHPASGEDVKVMAMRRGRVLHLTVAAAMVDRFFTDEASYFVSKEAIRHELQASLASELDELDAVDVEVNTLDLSGRGLDGMYLTVLGTSAECGDGGEVGRGNRVNGLISLTRPMSMEAAAGKNPTSHVGKIYNVLAHRIAGAICTGVEPVVEARVWLCSQIGRSIDEPWFASTRLALASGIGLADVAPNVEAIVRRELADVAALTERLSRGELSVW